MSKFPLLTPSETLLEGKWLFSGGVMVADDTSRRIEFLTSNVLVQVAKDDSGWVTLFRDPRDRRYWELSYPESGEHGGGAPVLRCIAAAEAELKYSVA